MKFDRLVELLADFKANGIRNSGKTGLDKVIEYQDIIGRSTWDEVYKEAWEKFDAIQKQTFIWASSCCLSPETVTTAIMETIGRDTKRKILKQFEAEYESIERREIELSKRHEALNVREQELRKTVDAQVQIQDILNELRR